jgi:hypothetical protein
MLEFLISIADLVLDAVLAMIEFLHGVWQAIKRLRVLPNR